MWLRACFVCVLAAAPGLGADANVQVKKLARGGIAIWRPGLDTPLLQFNAPEDGRPYVHPLTAPEGKAILTEYSPDHHKHQTGIFVGFLKVNGRDFFHNRGADHFRQQAFQYSGPKEGSVYWQADYLLLDAQKEPLLLEQQSWQLRDFTQHMLVDLAWKATAKQPITFDKHDYGGLFVRMPWKGKGEAINSAGQPNAKAEGQKAKWVDIGLPVGDGKTVGHIAVLAHAKNPGAPLPWRVDGQLGVGPAPSRTGAWKLGAGESVVFRYRFYVYVGPTQADQVEAEWKAFSESK